MSAERNRAVVGRIAEMFNEGRIEALGQCVSPRLVLHSPLMPAASRGADDLRDMFATILAGFPGGKLHVEELTAEEDRVAMRFVFSGAHTGVMRGNPPSGRTMQWREAMFFRFATDGTVAEMWHLINVLEVLDKMGALPPAAVRARIQTVVQAVGKVRALLRGRR